MDKKEEKILQAEYDHHLPPEVEAALAHDHHDASCGCGHDHVHSREDCGRDHHEAMPDFAMSPEDKLAMEGFRRELFQHRDKMEEFQRLHREIDAALAGVDEKNIGRLLTQKKNVKALRKLCAEFFGTKIGHNPMQDAMRAAEEDYIANVESILRDARRIKTLQEKGSGLN